MEKIQHNINSLSLIFSAFFVIEILILLGGIAMQPSISFTSSDYLKMIAFHSMIPVAIILLQLCAKYKNRKLLWLSLSIFVIHYAIFLI